MPDALKITTLDLSSHTGWASGMSDGEPRFGTYDVPSGKDLGKFAAAFHDWLYAFLQVEKPDFLIFEAPILPKQSSSTPTTARMLMGLAWHTEYVCYRLGIARRESHLQSIKKFFTGIGNAKKDEMMRIAFLWGWKVRNDNEADALALWCFSVHKLRPEHGDRYAIGPIGARACR